MSDTYRAFFDFESTDNDPVSARICAIGLAITLNGEIVETYSKHINPQTQSTDAAYQVHKLSDSYLKTCPTLDEVMPEFLEILMRYNTNLRECVAHNADFDTQLLNHEMMRMHKEGSFNIFEWAQEAHPEYIPAQNRRYIMDGNNSLCNGGIPIAEEKKEILYFQDFFNIADNMVLGFTFKRSGVSLDAMAKELGLDDEVDKRKDVHDATDDAKLTAMVYEKMLKERLGGKDLTTRKQINQGLGFDRQGFLAKVAQEAVPAGENTVVKWGGNKPAPQMKPSPSPFR